MMIEYRGTVTLAPSEVAMAEAEGRRRWNTDRSRGYSDKRYDPDAAKVDRLGAMGEVAFAKMVHGGWYRDKALVVMLDGRRIDVVSTGHQGGHLLVDGRTKPGRCWGFALMIPDLDRPREWRCVGWVREGELLKAENISERFNGGYAMPQVALHSMDILADHALVGAEAESA